MINEEYSPAAKQAFDKVKQGMLGNVSKLFDKYKNPDAIIYGRARKELKKVQDMENTNKLKEAIKKALTKENSTPTKTQTYDGVTYDSSNGSPFDRGSADRYYGRNASPHKRARREGGGMIDITDLTPEEEKAYMAGYDWEQERKDWLEEKAEFPDLTGDGKVTKADILKGRGIELEEDLDLGHEDDEPHMIKAELYKIGKYAMELYQMVDQFEGPGEVDFPAWWQSKITNAASMISSAKHYLEFELKEPAIDAMVGVAQSEDVIDDNKSTYIEEIKTKVLEKLTAKTPMKTYVKDFAKSDAPQFKGKTKEKKRQMAVAAKLSKEK
jgi:hypothetical protein